MQMKYSFREIEFGLSKHDFDISSCPNIIKSTKANISFSRTVAISMALRAKQTQFDKNKIQRDCLRNMLMYFCCFVKWNKNVLPAKKHCLCQGWVTLLFNEGNYKKYCNCAIWFVTSSFISVQPPIYI